MSNKIRTSILLLVLAFGYGLQQYANANHQLVYFMPTALMVIVLIAQLYHQRKTKTNRE